MKRILGLALALFCAAMVYSPGAAAQCGQSCQTLYDLESKEVVGFACVTNTDSRNTCTATASTCALERCGGSSMILDAKGTLLASAQLCGDEVRDIQAVAVVAAKPEAWMEAAASVTVTKKPREARPAPSTVLRAVE
jgi:hypothetical protein